MPDYPSLQPTLVNRRVTLITAFGGPAALAAKSATTKIPIVFAVSANPIEIGLVASLNHPGTNVTGVSGMAVGREHKRLELLHAAVPPLPLYWDFFLILRIQTETHKSTMSSPPLKNWARR